MSENEIFNIVLLALVFVLAMTVIALFKFTLHQSQVIRELKAIVVKLRGSHEKT